MYGVEYVRAILSEITGALPKVAPQEESLQSLRMAAPEQQDIERSLADYEQYVANRECVLLASIRHEEVTA